MIIGQSLYGRMIAHCRTCHPDEACGMLAGRDDRITHIYEMTNSEPSPVSYLMDPGEQFRTMKEMREKGLKLAGIYHSHPHSPAYPSPKDVGLAFYEEAVYVIVSLAEEDNPVVNAFRIVEGKVEEVPVEVDRSG